MKGKLTILLSFVLIGAVFGLPYIFAGCNCDLSFTGPTSIHRGDEFTVEILVPTCECPRPFDLLVTVSYEEGATYTYTLESNSCEQFHDVFINLENVELISENVHTVVICNEDCTLYNNAVFKCRALEYGYPVAKFQCNEKILNIAVTPKEYPMQQFMNILEKNKNK
ncbi:MAG TPA: hypothetical protein PKH80_00390 [Methanofastidiosum sp.]|nr:hypothetical protein [Methanofastidiosum sp.]HNU61361.1 hypothetical protein [Methanofastidiosum sp.]